MIKQEKINRKIALKRVKDNLEKLNSSSHSIKDIFDITFSRENFTFLTIMSNYGYKEITYGASKEQIINFAYYFSKNIGSGNKYIGIYLSNSKEWIYSFYGLLMAGFVPVLLSTANDDKSNKSVIDRLNIQTIISDKNLFDLSFINPFKIDVKDRNNFVPSWSNEIVFITSGTTGLPKIVFYSGKELSEQLNNAGEIIKSSKLLGSSYKGYLKQLAVLPFYHVFGLIAVLMWFSFFNTTIVIPFNLSPMAIRQACLLTNVTHIFAVPLFWNTVTNQIKDFCKENNVEDKFIKGINLSIKIQTIFPHLGIKIVKNVLFKKYLKEIFGPSLSCAINGGAHLDLESFKIINGLGYPLVNGYGSTETGITSLCSTEHIKDRISNSIGNSFSSITYTMKDDENGNSILYVSGSSISKKIIAREMIKINETGSVNSEDIVFKKGNKLYIKGRNDEIVVNKNGENYSLPLIEGELSFPSSDAFVLINNQESLDLLISYNDFVSKKIIKQELENFFKSNNKVIKNVYYTNLLFPKANDIKLKRKEIYDMFIEKHDSFKLCSNAELSSEFSLENICLETKEKVMSCFKKIFPNQDIALDSHFYHDLSGDSLKHYILLSELQKSFGHNIKITMNECTPRDIIVALGENDL